MFYLMVNDLNNTYECSWSDEIIPYDDPGSQIVIKFVKMVEYRNPWLILGHFEVKCNTTMKNLKG